MQLAMVAETRAGARISGTLVLTGCLFIVCGLDCGDMAGEVLVEGLCSSSVDA